MLSERWSLSEWMALKFRTIFSLEPFHTITRWYFTFQIFNFLNKIFSTRVRWYLNIEQIVLSKMFIFLEKYSPFNWADILLFLKFYLFGQNVLWFLQAVRLSDFHTARNRKQKYFHKIFSIWFSQGKFIWTTRELTKLWLHHIQYQVRLLSYCFC